MSDEAATIEVSPELKEMGDKIAGLTLKQAKELSDYLKDAYGIEPAAGGAVIAGPMPGAAGEAEAVAKTEFDVVLTGFGDKKLNVVKVVKNLTGTTLMDAKKLVEGVPAMSEFSAEEVRRLRELLEIEEIRKLGLLYSQLQDHGYLDRLLEIFTADALCQFGPYGEWRGVEEMRVNYAKVKQDMGGEAFAALHANSHHWVELTGPTTAVGRRYLLDLVLARPASEHPFLWLGLYDEEYRKEGGRWKIARTTLQFLWPERHLSGDFPGEFPPRG